MVLNMTALNKLLDKARATRSLPSDMALAVALGVTKGAVSMWRHGGVITEKHLAALIELADADPSTAVLVMREQASTPAQVRVWETLRSRLLHIMSSAARSVRLALGARA